MCSILENCNEKVFNSFKFIRGTRPKSIKEHFSFSFSLNISKLRSRAAESLGKGNKGHE